MQKNYIFTLQYSVTVTMFILIFAGCGPAPTVLINPDYGSSLIKGTGIAVSLAQQEVFIENTDDVADDLGSGDAYEVYMKFFKEAIPKAIKKHSTFGNVVPLDLPPGKFVDSNLVEHSYTVGDNQVFHVNVPKDGSKINMKNDSIRFVLYLEGFKLFRNEGKTTYRDVASNGMPTAHGTTSKLTLQLRFALWDNELGKTAIYGLISVEDELGLGMTKSDWETILARASKIMFSKSPFKTREYE